MESIIEIRGLRKEVSLGSSVMPILKSIDLQVRRGEFLTIMGPSGSGKSTLMGLMAGLDGATAGSIKIDGIEIVGLGEDALARLRAQRVGIVFQAFHLMPTLTALENVALPLELAGGKKAAAQAKEALEAVGLGQRMQHYPRQMSGGEQQRVAIARALAAKPGILFADEPTGNLDSVNGKQVMELLLNLTRSYGTTLVMVTHDANLAALADRTIHMQDGMLVREEVRPHARVAR